MMKRTLGAITALPLLRVGVSGATFAARAARACRQGGSIIPDVPAPAPSIGLAAAVALDKLFISPAGLIGSIVPTSVYAASSNELDEALAYYGANGWLDDSSSYFGTPSAPSEVEVRRVERRNGPFEMLRFPSGWAPHQGEPGGERWCSFTADRQAYVRLLRHEGGPWPWLVAVHGQNMGRAGDIDTLRVRHLHQELGINIALPVLPLHGKRRAGFRPEQQFVSNVYPVNNVIGLAQSMWDLRRLLAWLREHEAAPSIGALGYSLGSYAVALLSTLDAGLDCVVAVIPSADMAEPLRAVEPLAPSKQRAHRTVHDWRSTVAHSVVSPLARPCLVPCERRFIVAGQGDQVAPPAGAVLLWKHWEQPSILWRPCGHLTTARSAAYDGYLTASLGSSGLTAR